jgi:mannonate dehydratase
MKLGLGLYRHMLNDEYCAFAVQAGCTQVIAHLVDYFQQAKPIHPTINPPAAETSHGLTGDPSRLWTAAELIAG